MSKLRKLIQTDSPQLEQLAQYPIAKKWRNHANFNNFCNFDREFLRMPRKSKPGSAYPKNWAEIATAVKEAANWRCVRCGREADLPRISLGVHHADMDPSHNEWFNLWVLCSPCHLQIQVKVDLNRPWVMTEHSDWAKPYMGGYFAWKYLGKQLSRDEVEANLDYYVNLERKVVLL